MEYFIKTYTNKGETVLDFTMGSGTTGIAAKQLNRNFIGIELDPDYFEIAKKRIEEAKPQIEDETPKNTLEGFFG
jgi:site-specific DNA-methyltransferase (adenine-specific)